MTNDEHNNLYALAKQIPSMEYGFTVHTPYGDIFIAATEARPFMALMEKAINKRLPKRNTKSA